MTNKEIARLLKLAASLMELHDENTFKIRAFTGAVFAIDKLTVELSKLSPEDMEKTEGLGKSMVSKIQEMTSKGSFTELDALLERTPEGVAQMLLIKGIGPKKIKLIWKEAGIETIDALCKACEENRIAALKGFGEKTQQTILENIVFLLQQKGKFYYSETEPLIDNIQKELDAAGFTYSLSGEARRYLEITDMLRFLIASEDTKAIFSKLDTISLFEKSPRESGPFAWRGQTTILGVRVEFKVCAPAAFGSQLIIDSSAPAHLERVIPAGGSLISYFRKNHFSSEKEAYESVDLPVFLPELREGLFEFNWAEKNAQLVTDQNSLITFKDLKGTLHNHTVYSDGEHTLLQMAQRCIAMGLEYFGVADHSKSAQYANGLYEERVLKQHKEIDELNKELAPFKILKGIESDILNDGSLDYDDQILKTFDYVVASVHSGLKMDEARATNRLIRAIENPYTTILGHPTGRLLLRRQGYPLDFVKIIDACAANGVCIEINASPYRLDLDWRWIPYALEKGVTLSINPDAHEMDGLMDMHYGVYVARKGGLTAVNCLNAYGLAETEAFFKKRQLVNL